MLSSTSVQKIHTSMKMYFTMTNHIKSRDMNLNDPMVVALRDMLEDNVNVCVLVQFVHKRTCIYAVDSLVFEHYCPRQLSEDKDKSFNY